MKTTPPAATRGASSTQTLLIAIQLGAVVGLLFWAVMLKRDLGVAQEELAGLRQRPAPSVTETLQKENRGLRDRLALLETQLTDANAAVTAANAAAAAAAAANKPAPVATTAPANALANLASAMSNPAMRNLVATQQKRSMETRYAELFTVLQFTPDQRTRFIDMIMEAQAPIMDATLKAAAGTLTPEEQAAMRQKAREIETTMEGKIRDFLGDDSKYAVYKQFNEQQAERTQVNALKSSLAQANLTPLNPAQATALTELMYAERKSVPLTPTNIGGPNGLTDEAVATRLREQAQLNERIASRAAAFLSPDQVTNLRQEQTKRLEAMKDSAAAVQQLTGSQPARK